MDTSVQLISKIDIGPQYELHDGTLIGLMGYTKLLGEPINLPSPTLIFEEGDSVRLSMWNLSQGAPHTIHLHGLDVDQQNDGVPQLSFEIPHDSTGNYYFKAPHPGTYIYHCHVMSVLHVQAGMYGLLIVKPKNQPNLTRENGYEFDSEHAWLMSEVDTNWHHDSILNEPHGTGMAHSNVLPYAPQHYLINGKSEQQLNGYGITASVGEKVYLRLANIGYYANTVIFPVGLNAQVISSDGRPLPNPFQSDTVHVYPGERFGVLLEATAEFADMIQIRYTSLNTHTVADIQEMDVSVFGFVGEEELPKKNLYAYPNPANSYLNLPTSGSWKLLDSSGRYIDEIYSESCTYDVSKISNGFYIVEQKDDPQTRVDVLIQH
jgi:FtsP/CotA-like multicopper oxidase with cupredoxin domain